MSKNHRAQSWSTIAPDFDQIGPPFFAQSGKRLVELAQIEAGSFVLDAATGRGIDTSEGLRQRLHQAQFEQVTISEETAVLIYADEQQGWSNLWALGTRRTLEKMKPSDQKIFRTNLFQKLQQFKKSDGLHIPVRTLFALATKPKMIANG